MHTQNKYPHALIKGTTLKQGTYTIDKVLGAGGFGVTYIGTQKPITVFEDPKQIVIKELFINADKDYFSTRDHSNNTVIPQSMLVERYAEFKDRFKNEAETLHKFRNLEGTVNVLDYFEENETAYFTMAYIEAQTLTDVVKQANGLPLDQALDYIKQVGEVLIALHKKNVLHRDIKPDNILLDNNGKVYLIDFGIAKQYDETGIVTKITGMGTNRYAPPEQLAGIKDLISFAMDVFGLANTLYYFLTAKDPQTSQEEEIYGKKTVLDFCPNISTELNDAIEKARVKRPQDRTQSVEDFLEELDVDKQDKQGFGSKEETRIKKINKNPIVENENTIIETDTNLTNKPAEWFSTPQRRTQWWNQLEDQWKRAFNEVIFKTNTITKVPDEKIMELFKSKYLFVQGVGGHLDKNDINKNRVNLSFKLTNLSGIAHLSNLKFLRCSNNQINELNGIQKLRNLIELNCSNNELVDLKGLESLKILSTLDCSKNSIVSLKGIENSIHLKILFCSNNQLENLTEIKLLTKITKLFCYSNHIHKLDGVEGLYKIRQLWCFNNNISSIEPLEDLLNNHQSQKVNIDLSRNPISLNEGSKFSKSTKNGPLRLKRKFPRIKIEY